MDRRLLLIRHAKSSWDDPALPDRKRPLSGRGRKAAARVGGYLRREDLRPDLVLCSPATRARETLELLGLRDANAVYPADVYGASADELLELVRSADADAATVAVIGHNPEVQDLATELAGNDAAADAVRLREKFPTCSVAVFDVDGPWRDLTPRHVRLTSFVVPKELP
jgi:phosphohistidine phosphatase